MSETPVWRVLAWNPVQMAWTVRSTHDEEVVALRQAAALKQQDRRLRVTVRPGTKRVLQIAPAVASETRQWRFAQAGRMSDLADAKKRYKSPG